MLLERLLRTAIGCAALIGAVAGCAGDEDLAEATYVAECEGARARVWIPVNEPRSVGTYRAEVEWPGGAADDIEAQRDGMIAAVWLCDLESDGTLELVVATSSAGSGDYGSAHVYRNEGGKLVRVGLSPMDDTQRVGYMGHDLFSVEDGRLRRSYPLYREDDPNAAPSGGTARLWYSFADSAWVSETGGAEDEPSSGRARAGGVRRARGHRGHPADKEREGGT